MLHTPNFYFVRKKAGIPSTHGQKTSFLDIFPRNYSHYHQFYTHFGREQERWLLNRLDNATQGLLYFAKTPADKLLYQHLQQQKKLTKYYVAQVYGRIKPKFGWITHPIAHHPTDKVRMVVCITPHTSHRSKPQQVTSYYEHMQYDVEQDCTRLSVHIAKGARHQIRCHMASIGHPIINDPLYTTKWQRKKLRSLWRYVDGGQLWLVSVWLKYPLE